MIKKIDLALILIEQFASLKEMCFGRTVGCEGCPFYVDLACTLKPTDEIVRVVGDAAREYLIESGIYPLDHKQMTDLINDVLKAKKKGD